MLHLNLYNFLSLPSSTSSSPSSSWVTISTPWSSLTSAAHNHHQHHHIIINQYLHTIHHIVISCGATRFAVHRLLYNSRILCILFDNARIIEIYVFNLFQDCNGISRSFSTLDLRYEFAVSPKPRGFSTLICPSAQPGFNGVGDGLKALRLHLSIKTWASTSFENGKSWTKNIPNQFYQ